MDWDDDACYRALATRDPRFDGRVFVGVKTTGIYCRPICPARTPKRVNVRFFPSAAAAQGAGFRPCLRCRPESSPDLGAWRGAASTVSRALALIEAGALDRDDVEALAARLGVGQRQLRRLFRQHLGASPIAVAQTRRVLLAKQLIHETRMPMAEVALAAGFGSLRRFNEAFQLLFARPPASLRRDSAAADQGKAATLRLAYQPPYDWDAVLEFLQARAIAGVETVADGTYVRSLAIDEGRGTVMVRPGAGHWLSVTIHFPDLRAWTSIVARVRRVFDLSAQPAVIAAHLARDPALAGLVAARPGLRAPGAWDGFELAVRAILGQQVSVAAARKLAGKLVGAFGETLPPELQVQGVTHVFPAPQQLVEADIAGLGMPRSRGAALNALSAAALAGPQLFAPRADLAEAVARLRELPGVGEWTAQYIALRALREPDAFPVGDVALARAMGVLEGRRPSASDLARRAEAWRPWRAYAAQHLWTADAAKEGADARRAA